MDRNRQVQETAIRHIRHHDQVTRRSLATSQQPIAEQQSGMPEQAGIWDEDIAEMELWLYGHKKDLSIWW